MIDNFVSDYQALKDFSLSCEFSDVKNDIDGVVYPYICSDISEDIKSDVLESLKGAIGRDAENVTMFLRMSPSGVSCPHTVHHDGSMGDFSLMLYLNDHSQGGTAFVSHRQTGISYAPQDEIFAGIIIQDQNNPDKWQQIDKAVMKQNRALIFDARKLHCALPIGGFGEDQSDSRIVLTAFFS